MASSNTQLRIHKKLLPLPCCFSSIMRQICLHKLKQNKNDFWVGQSYLIDKCHISMCVWQVNTFSISATSWPCVMRNFKFTINWSLKYATNRFSMISMYCSHCVALILHCCFLCSVFPLEFQTNAVLILSMNINQFPWQVSSRVRIESNKVSQWRAALLLLLQHGFPHFKENVRSM